MTKRAETLRYCWGISGKAQVQTGRFTLCTIMTWLHGNCQTYLRAQTLSLAINHTFMQVGVYPSVTLK